MWILIIFFRKPHQSPQLSFVNRCKKNYSKNSILLHINLQFLGLTFLKKLNKILFVLCIIEFLFCLRISRFDFLEKFK